jgi:4-amino-4-deoxy-L-arabinose transferase-like glycosyltransferase
MINNCEMENLPSYISLLFALTTAFTVFFFYKATHFSRLSLLLVMVWLAVVAVVSITGFFTVTNTFPPRFALLVAPPLLLLTAIFITTPGRQFLNQLNLKTLTLLHVVRIPVELVLFFLSINKVAPEIMTFEGRNFDILSGMSAPAGLLLRICESETK